MSDTRTGKAAKGKRKGNGPPARQKALRRKGRPGRPDGQPARGLAVPAGLSCA
jgi:hypothetical protein